MFDASRLRVGQLELELEKERSRVEKPAETRDISTQTSTGPAQVAPQSQAALSSPSPAADPSQQVAPPPRQQEAPLSTFQQQHLASRPSNVPPERIQVTALVHSAAQESREEGGAQTQDGGRSESPELAPLPQTVAPPSSAGIVQMAVPFTRYFAHVASHAPASSAHAAPPAVDGSTQVAAAVEGESTQLAAPLAGAPVADDASQVAELSRRLSQTEMELERVRVSRRANECSHDISSRYVSFFSRSHT